MGGPCCAVCPEGFEKVYSIITKNHLCGESCLKPEDYWKYKIFEPKMQIADKPDEPICAEHGYRHYNQTEVHGFKPLLSIKLDMYDDYPHTDDDEKIIVEPTETTIFDKIKEEVDELIEEVKEKIIDWNEEGSEGDELLGRDGHGLAPGFN